MSVEKKQIVADLRAVFGDLFPYRNASLWNPSDEAITIIAQVRREKLVRYCEPGYAEGAVPQKTVMRKRRKAPDDR